MHDCTRNEATTSGTNSENSQQQQQQLLIPGLPDDLALRCLELLALKLPRRDHALVRCVCRRWNAFWSSDKLLALRARSRASEGWLYVLSRDKSECLHWHALDPSRRRWISLPQMPDSQGKYGLACEALGRELFVMGGCDKYEDPTKQVFRYDALKNKWSPAPDMQQARCHFVSASLHGKLFAIGGMGLKSGALTSWEIFDPEENSWSLFDGPNVVSDLGESLVWEGRIYVRHASPNVIPPSYAAVYDPGSNSWASLHNQMTLQWYGPAVSVEGDVDGDHQRQQVCMLDQNFGIKLMVLDSETNEWSTLGRLSPRSIGTPCRIAGIGKNLFIVGRGLRTIVLDLEKAGTNRGMLVTSSIEGLESAADDIIVSCNVIAI